MYNGEILVSTLAPSFLIGSSSFYAGNEDNYKSLDELEFGQNSVADFGETALERLKKRHIILLAL